MAVGNISGPLLTANLLRNGKDLAFETNLLFLNVSDPDPQNFKVGIGTSSPSYLLDISGITRSTKIKSTEVDIGNVNIKNNTIKSSVNNLTIQAATSSDKIVFSSNVESTFSSSFSSLSLTNALPVTSGGTGVTTSTGSGSVVLSDTPSLTTPSLGDATATSINKVSITPPITSSTLTLANGSTLITSGSYSLTLTTTANSIVTFPTTGLLINSNETTLSSLSSVGTITTGTWSGLFGAVTGANLTHLTADNLEGTIPSTVLGNSSIYIGTTSVALNRTSGSLTLADVHFGTTDVSTSFTIPSGNTATRPSTPTEGNIRYNTDTANYEGYAGSHWGKISSGLTPTPVKVGVYTATESQLVRCNSSLGSFSVNLPSSPVDGWVVGIIDVANSFKLFPVTIVPSAGTKIENDSTSMILDVDGTFVSFVYVESTTNWKLQETPNMLSNVQLMIASTDQAGAVKVDGNSIVINNQGVISATGIAGNSTILSVIGTNPIVSSGGTTPAISIIQSSSTTNGYLSSTDWNIFNNKLSSVPHASQYTVGGIKVGAGLEIDLDGTLRVTGAVIVPVATASTIGGIRIGSGMSIDMNGILNTSNFVLNVAAASPMSSSGGNQPTISIQQATTNANGYLSSTDWNIFNNKLSSVPIASANILGGVKIGAGLSIDGFGVVSTTTSYALPIASDVTLGGVKVDGTTITINNSGVISSYGKLTLQVFTSNSTPQALTINADLPSSTNQLIIAANQAVVFTGLLIGKQQGSDKVATYTIRGTAVNHNSVVSLVSSSVTNIDDTISVTVSPAFSVDSTNSAITLSSGAKAATNIKWTAIFDLTSSTYSA